MASADTLTYLISHAPPIVFQFTSFTRRLKRWGFSRIASGPQIGAYQNPDFTKEEPERVKNIKYMHPKPLSLAAIQRQNAKMQAAAKMNAPAGHNSLGNQAPPQDLTMLQTLLAQQQQMGMQMPGQVTNPQAFMASSAPPTNSVAMQLAMLQEMQNQHGMQQMQVSLAASAEEPKPNESFGEKLVRTNPALAAQLIEAKSLNMMSPNGGMAANIASNPMLAMLAAQSNRMQQPSMNLAMLQQMSNPRGEQNNLTAMMFALLQQEQQQQQLQQPKDFIKNFMSQQIQPQPQDQRQQQRASLSDNSLVTPMSSAASLHANLIDGKFKQGSPSDENWLSALLNRNNNAGTKQNPAPNPDGNGKSGDV